MDMERATLWGLIAAFVWTTVVYTCYIIAAVWLVRVIIHFVEKYW